MVSQFRVDPQTVDKMRVLGKGGRFAGRRVRLFRIFDPALIEQVPAIKLKFDDLDIAGRGKALLFNGHIEGDGGIFLTPAAAAAGT
jgi:hypothetical protein